MEAATVEDHDDMRGAPAGRRRRLPTCARRAELLALGRERGGDNVRVVGSVARGEARPESDLDLLVEFHPGISLLSVLGLEADARAL